MSLSCFLSPVPFIPSRTRPPSQQLSILYLIQLAGSADHDESFLFDFPSSYSSLFLSFRFSPLVTALLIFILTRYTSCSFLYHFLVLQLPSRLPHSIYTEYSETLSFPPQILKKIFMRLINHTRVYKYVIKKFYFLINFNFALYFFLNRNFI